VIETETTDYLIIGGGPAGYSASKAIRELDMVKRVVLVTNETHLPYTRVPLTKNYLTGKLDRNHLFLSNKEFYNINKIQVLTGQNVLSLNTGNRTVELEDKQEITFDHLLLAVGGRARKLTISGADLEGIYYLRTLDDCENIKKQIDNHNRVVIIGGGFIGCEIAASFASKGLEAIIIEMGPFLLNMAIDEETSVWITDYFAHHGIKLMMNTTVASFVGVNGRVTGVETKEGKIIPSDFVIVGIGVIPNIELAQQAGLKTEKGIVVNEYLETGANKIYAAGDVARFYCPFYERQLRVEHYDVAVKQGRIAGFNMVGNKQAFTDLPYFFSTMFQLKVMMYGTMSEHNQVVRRGDLNLSKGFIQFYLENDRINGFLAMNRSLEEVKVANSLTLKHPILNNPSMLSNESKDLKTLF